MSGNIDLHMALLANGARIISEGGLDELSLRAVADATDCSTTAIVQRFKNKAGFIEAIAGHVLEKDQAFHDGLLESLSGAPLSFPYLHDILLSYIEQRSSCPTARVWSEILVGESTELAAGSIVESWYIMRQQFWQALLALAGKTDPLQGSVVTNYVIMEEIFAFELFDDFEYRLLLKESTRALLAGLLGISDTARDGAMCKWATKNLASYSDFPERTALINSVYDNEPARKLLDTAANEMFAHGIGSLNKRRVTKLAGMSSSMINYHFGSQTNFIKLVIWQSLWIETPREFKTPYEARSRHRDINEWVEFMQWMAHPKSDNDVGGFYFGFSRLTAQAGLQARRQPDLRRLFQQSRRIDGWGSFEAGNSFWPKDMNVTRGNAAAFGIWIKGSAVLNGVLRGGQAIPAEELRFVAQRLFYQARPPRRELNGGAA